MSVPEQRLHYTGATYFLFTRCANFTFEKYAKNFLKRFFFSVPVIYPNPIFIVESPLSCEAKLDLTKLPFSLQIRNV